MNNLAASLILKSWPENRPNEGLPVCQPVQRNAAVRTLLPVARLLNDANQGRIAWLAGDCGQAREIWGSRLARFPDDDQAFYWLFWLDPDLALSSSSPTMRKEIAQYSKLAGDSVYSEEEFIAATDWYLLSFKLKPDLSLAERLVSIYERTRDRPGLERFLASVFERFPAGSVEQLWATGQAALVNKDWQAAARAFGQAAARSEHPFGFLIEQAGALERQGELSGAEQAYLQAIRLEPEEYYPYLGIGRLKRMAGEDQASIEWLLQAEQLAPQNYLPKFELGLLYFEAGDRQAARRYFEQAAEINPGDPYLQEYLANFDS